MKKLIVAILFVSMFLLNGCGNSGSTKTVGPAFLPQLNDTVRIKSSGQVGKVVKIDYYEYMLDVYSHYSIYTVRVIIDTDGSTVELHYRDTSEIEPVSQSNNIQVPKAEAEIDKL